MKLQKVINAFFPFWKKSCAYCGERFDISYSLFRGHTITGLRYVACRHCKKVNYNDFEIAKPMLLDEQSNEFVFQKENGHQYLEGEFSIINKNNFHIVVFAIALNILILHYAIVKIIIP